MKIYFFVGLTILVLGFFVFGSYELYKKSNVSSSVACTMEAKICADGSAVGRIAPDCEFALCPVVSTGKLTVSGVKINQTVAVGGVTITPLSVTQDSRCPAGVSCIWAGTVVLHVRLATGNQGEEISLTLGKPVSFSQKEITLTTVAPSKTKTSITDGEYRFGFSVK